MTDARTLLTLDTLVSGTHFWPDADPRDVGYKAAMVNLSDIAAMGGTPEYILIGSSFPAGLDDDFYNDFLDGLAGAQTVYYTWRASNTVLEAWGGPSMLLETPGGKVVQDCGDLSHWDSGGQRRVQSTRTRVVTGTGKAGSAQDPRR